MSAERRTPSVDSRASTVERLQSEVDTGLDAHTKRANRIVAICLVTVAVGMLGLIVAAGLQVDGVLHDFRQRHLDQGYESVDGRSIIIEPAPTAPLLIYAQKVTLSQGSNASLAIYGGDAVLEGRIEGDVAFLGANLDLAPGAVITGDLTLDVAKHVTLRGRVLGELHGEAGRMYGDPTTDTEP